MLYVTDLVELINDMNNVCICVLNDNLDTFQFHYSDIPCEIEYMKVQSIDNPEYSDNEPLTINIDPDEFDDYEFFKKEFKDYLV